MFERYDINDLFLAYIEVSDQNNLLEMNFEGNYPFGAKPFTVLLKIPEMNLYLDLGNDGNIIVDDKDSHLVNNCTIKYIVPLSKYYNLDGEKKRNVLNKKKALLEARKYYEVFRIEYLQALEEEQTKSL